MADCPGVHKLTEMKDGYLARIRVPGGQLSAEKLSCLASAAEKYGAGVIDLTNRANLQIRGIKAKQQPNLLADLLAHELISKDPIHDRLRNIAIDPLSGLMREEIDCYPLSTRLDKALIKLPCRGELSPKFSFVLDGGGPSVISGLRADMTLIANKRQQKLTSFELWLNGHQTPLQVSADALCETIIHWLSQLVALAAPKKLRIKELIKDKSLQAIVNSLSDAECVLPNGPVKELQPQIGTKGQYKTKHLAVNLTLPSGRLFAFQASGLAELAERYSGGEIRLTPWQAVILPNVKETCISDVWEKSEQLGFLTQEAEQNLSIISCAGCKGCIHGGFETKMKALEIRDNLADMAFPNPITIHLSGCEKGCATRQKTPYLIMQRTTEQKPRLYVNASPTTKKAGKEVEESQLIAELKKLI